MEGHVAIVSNISWIIQDETGATPPFPVCQAHKPQNTFSTQCNILKYSPKFTFAPCLWRTSITSLWARSAATCKGVMKLDLKRKRLFPAFKCTSEVLISVRLSLKHTLYFSHWQWLLFEAVTLWLVFVWGEEKPQHSAVKDAKDSLGLQFYIHICLNKSH